MRQFLTVIAVLDGFTLVEWVAWQVFQSVEWVLAFKYPVNLEIMHEIEVQLLVVIVPAIHLVVGAVLAYLARTTFWKAIVLELYVGLVLLGGLGLHPGYALDVT